MWVQTENSTARTDKYSNKKYQNKPKKDKQMPSKGSLDYGVQVSPLTARKRLLKVSVRQHDRGKSNFQFRKKVKKRVAWGASNTNPELLTTRRRRFFQR
ncbi:hypothetical protein TNCV_4378281 [Trichonephila clavipes]|nr:hypothetical protein TNCV_4378281 [Trichonephila clavipes]